MNKTDVSFAATLAAIFAVTVLALTGLAHERLPQANADSAGVTLERVVVTAARSATPPAAEAVASASATALEAAPQAAVNAHRPMPI